MVFLEVMKQFDTAVLLLLSEMKSIEGDASPYLCPPGIRIEALRACER